MFNMNTVALFLDILDNINAYLNMQKCMIAMMAHFGFIFMIRLAQFWSSEADYINTSRYLIFKSPLIGICNVH